MKTKEIEVINTVENPEVAIGISKIQQSMIIKVLASAQHSFYEASEEEKKLLGPVGFDFLSNENFVCCLTTEEYEALTEFIK